MSQVPNAMKGSPSIGSLAVTAASGVLSPIRHEKPLSPMRGFTKPSPPKREVGLF